MENPKDTSDAAVVDSLKKMPPPPLSLTRGKRNRLNSFTLPSESDYNRSSDESGNESGKKARTQNETSVKSKKGRK